MKNSIKNIFKNLNRYLLFVLFTSLIAIILMIEQSLSFMKLENLNEQKKTIASLTKLQRDDVDLALIQFNGKSTHLHQQIEKLRSFHKYNFSDRYLFFNSEEYLRDLSKLSELTTAFNNAAHKYYVKTEVKDPQIEAKTKSDLETAFDQINSQIDSIIMKSTLYDQKKFETAQIIIVVYFLIVLIATFWYRKRLNSIYNDIEFLHQIEKGQKTHQFFSLEADSIGLRMNRKSFQKDNPSMIDPVTEINNYKGMISAYSQKKGLKDSNFTGVSVLEIDNFSKTKRTYSQELTQSILKKIAYTISLHEQAVDVIARTDYNQFTLIFSRPSKEQLFKEVDLIRESISELRFNISTEQKSNITVSGGFIIKPNNTHLDEALRQAKEILEYAKSSGTNRVLQTRDMAEKDL